MRTSAVALLLCCILPLRSGRGAEERWPTDQPAERGKLAGTVDVKKTAAGCEISFALTAPNDATVRIVDAQARVVRHLASGMVGLPNAASPLAAGALRQTIAWDGTNDAGKPVAQPGLKVSVGVGGRARFDKIILGNPDGFGQFGAVNWSTPGALAVGPKGEVYFAEQYGVHFGVMRVLSREGKFVRQVWPYSLNHSKDHIETLFATKAVVWPNDVAAWGATDWEGRTVPRSVRHSAFYWYAARCPSLAVGRDGTIFMPAGTAVDGDGYLHRFGPNGLPIASLHWKDGCFPWIDKPNFVKAWSLAVGPEGDLYLADRLFGIVAHYDARGEKPVRSFQYAETQKLDEPTYLIGTPERKGGQWDPLWGLAVDKEGAIWVANFRDKALKIYRKDGLLLRSLQTVTVGGREVSLEGPVALAANLTSGAVYANIGPERGPRMLVKFNSAADPRVVAALDLPATAKSIAADSEAGVVWVLDRTSKLIRVEDLGEKLAARTIDGLAGATLTFPRLLAVDPAGRLYVQDNSSPHIRSHIDGKTFTRLPDWGYGHTVGHGYHACDPQGNWYFGIGVKDRGQQVWKLSPEGERLKFGDKEAIAIDNVKEFKGLTVAPNGDIYVAVTEPAGAKLVNEVVGKVEAVGEQYNFSRVDVYAPDGVLKKAGLVRLQGVNDVKLDRQGNIYVIEAGTCHGAHRRRAAKLDNKQFSLYGKFMKFAPGGGVRDQDGHLWTFRGVSVLSSYTCAGECHAAQLAVDADDRVWFCDGSIYNVGAVDGAGNLMFRVGAYGNADCPGGGGDRKMPGVNMVLDPEVPLSHPSGVAVWGDWLLISDMMTHRVLRCKLEFGESREIAVP